MLVTAPAYGRPVHPDQVSRDVEDIAADPVRGAPMATTSYVVQ